MCASSKTSEPSENRSPSKFLPAEMPTKKPPVPAHGGQSLGLEEGVLATSVRQLGVDMMRNGRGKTVWGGVWEWGFVKEE